MQMQLNIADGRCGYCGRGVHSRNAPHRWQGQWYCSLDCSHDAGDRTMCHGVSDCKCTAYSKLHRARRGFLLVRARQRILLAEQRERLTAQDFNMRLGDEDNLPYAPDDDMLLDFMGVVVMIWIPTGQCARMPCAAPLPQTRPRKRPANLQWLMPLQCFDVRG